MPEPTIEHTREESLSYLLRQRDRQRHEMQARMDTAATILGNAIIAKKPNWKRAVFAAHKALIPNR